MFLWNNEYYLRERTEERKRRFKEIGEKVFDFFTIQAIDANFQLRDGQLDIL